MKNNRNAMMLSAPALAANIAQIEAMPYASTVAGELLHNQIAAANASLFTEATFSEPLTAYAVGFRDNEDIEAALEFFAPQVSVPRRFEYMKFSNAEEFFSDDALDDDLRAIGADFKAVEYTSEKVLGKTENRGLRIVVDLDQVDENQDWETMYTAKLVRRLRRSALRRAIALLSAGAVNTAKTWVTTAGKDPDQDVIAELIIAANLSGVAPNRVGYGHTAYQKRSLAHRAQNTAGGFASAGLAPKALAGLLGVDEVHVNKARYQSGAATKAEVLGNLVLMFNALSGADTEDASNIKRFVSSAGAEGGVRVYSRQIASKLWEIAVEHYEKTTLTSTLGIRKFTVS